MDGDIGNLSRKRDLHTASHIDVSSWEELVQRLNEKNELWVQAMRGASPRILLELLESFGNQVSDYYASLDPHVIGGNVAWAGPDDAPVWLDIARNYTERWHHQQQIRETLGIPLLVQPVMFSPVIATFVRALPQTLAQVTAPSNTTLRVSINGDAGGDWFVVRESDSWRLYVEIETQISATLRLEQEDAWRLFTKSLPKSDIQSRVEVHGDESLALRVLDTVAIIA